jgi:hypothetical protein
VNDNGNNSASLEEDTLSSLRSLNQSRRRAVRVDATLRCAVCSRPLFMPPPPRILKLAAGEGGGDAGPAGAAAAASPSLAGAGATVGVGVGAGTGGKIWGPPSVGSGCPTGTVLYAGKHALHRVCLDVRAKLKK